jgi:hypothetical protein
LKNAEKQQLGRYNPNQAFFSLIDYSEAWGNNRFQDKIAAESPS